MNRICRFYGITDVDLLGELAYDSYHEKQPQERVAHWLELTQEERDRWNLVGETVAVDVLLTVDKQLQKTLTVLTDATGRVRKPLP